jgi:hypothetical protein
LVLDPAPATLRTFAFETVPATIPGDGTPVRLYARRPLAFYLAQLGRYSIQLEPSGGPLLQDSAADSWRILDDALPYDPGVTPYRPPWPPRYSARVSLDPVTLLDVAPESAFLLPSDQHRSVELRVFAPDHHSANSSRRLPATKAEAPHEP